jgi:hypothetical protein
MRIAKLLGTVALVVGGVAAGTVMGIFVERHLLQKGPIVNTALPPAPDVRSAISAREVPPQIERLGKLGNTPEAIREVQKFADQVDTNAFQAVVAHLGTLDGLQRQRILPPIFQRWARQDPSAALAGAAKLPAPDYALARTAVFEGWAKRDCAALIAWAAASTNATIRRDGLLVGVRDLTARDPQAALKELARLPQEEGLEPSYHAAVARWMQQDPKPALTWLEEQPDDARRRTAIRQIPHLIGAADPVAGSSLIQSLPTGYDRQSAIGNLADAWARQDSKAAVKWARELPEGADKDAALTRIIQQLGTVDPAAGAALIADAPFSHAVRGAARIFAAQYAKVAPEPAFDWAQKLPAGETRDEALESVLKTTAAQSPATAAAACTNLLTGFKRDQALRDILPQWVVNDAKAAANFAANLPLGGQRNELLNTVLAAWVAQNPHAAMTWVQTLENGLARRQADKLVVEAVARTDPEAAARFVEKLPRTEQNLALLTTTLDFWVPKNPDAAAAWVDGLSDQTLKQRGYERLAHQTALSDPARAARFAEKTDPKSHVRSSVAHRWTDIDPHAAAAWAVQLGTNRTDDPLPTVVSVWARKAPVEAASFVEKLPVERRRNCRIWAHLGVGGTRSAGRRRLGH